MTSRTRSARRPRKVVIGAAFAALTAAGLLGTATFAHADTDGPAGTGNCTLRVIQNGATEDDGQFSENFDGGGAADPDLSLDVDGEVADGAAVTVKLNCEVVRGDSAPENNYEFGISVTSNGTASSSGGGSSTSDCQPSGETIFSRINRQEMSENLSRIQFEAELEVAASLAKCIKFAAASIKSLGGSGA